jgi:hypothetical protein
MSVMPYFFLKGIDFSKITYYIIAHNAHIGYNAQR